MSPGVVSVPTMDLLDQWVPGALGKQISWGMSYDCCWVHGNSWAPSLEEYSHACTGREFRVSQLVVLFNLSSQLDQQDPRANINDSWLAV